MRVDVVGLGTVAVDVVAQVDSLPSPDGFALVTNQVELDGGSGSNVLVQVAKLGVGAGQIAQVGDDAMGRRIQAGLARDGVDTSQLQVLPGGHSLYTYIPVSRTGEKFIFLYMGDAFLALRPEQVNLDYIRGARVFYTDLLPFEAALAGLRAAREAGIPTVVNVQVGLPLMERFGVTASQIKEALAYVDLFAPSREAFFALVGESDPATALQRFWSEHPVQTILTLGSQGSMTLVDSQVTAIPAFDVQAVDTTGAGDSFIAALMVGHYVRGLPLVEALRFASAAAALTCTRLGARAMPTLDEVLQLLKA